MANKTPLKAKYTGSDTTALAEFESGDTFSSDLLDTGTSANQIVQLDSNAKLPAMDGSLLTNLPSGGGGGGATSLNELDDATDTVGASFNLGIGNDALELLTGGSYNLAVGTSAMQNVTGGSANCAVGQLALTDSSGNYNVAMGKGAAKDLSGGNENVAIGYSALSESGSKSKNAAIGSNSLLRLTTGELNIGLGNDAGEDITTGSNNTIVGSLAGTASLASTVLIGAGTTERLKIDSTGLYVNGSSTALGGGGGGGAWTKISTTTVSSSVSEAEFTLTGYSVYKIIFWDLNFGANENGVAIKFTVGASGTYSEKICYMKHRNGGMNGASTHSGYGNSYDEKMTTWGGFRPQSSNGTATGELTVFNAVGMPNLRMDSAHFDDMGVGIGTSEAWARLDSPSSTDTIGKIKFFGSSADNLESGTFVLYGLT